MSTIDSRCRTFFFVACCCAVVVSHLLFSYATKVNGDGLVFSLMAKHIAEGKYFPIFMLENHYAGTVFCYVQALLFKCTVLSPYHVHKIFTAILGVGYTALVFSGLRIFGATRSVAFVFAFCSPLAAWQSAQFNAGYAETLIFGTMLFLMYDRYCLGRLSLALLAFAAGFCVYLFPCLYVMAICVVCFAGYDALARKDFRGIALSCAAAVFGYMPAIVYNVQHPRAALYRAAGRLFGLDRSFLAESDKVGILMQKIAGKIAAVPHFCAVLAENYVHYFGPVWAVLFSVALAGIILQRGRHVRFYTAYIVLFSLMMVTLVQEEAGRYMTPLFLIAPFVVAGFFSSGAPPIFKRSVVGVTVVFWMWGFFGYIIGRTPSQGDRDLLTLVERLERAGVKTAYAEYTAAYAISYLSDERIAASEVRHSTVGVRYHPYAEAAAADAVQTYVCASGSAEVAERERVAERSGSLCAETVGGVYTAVTIMPPRTETSAAMRRSS